MSSLLTEEHVAAESRYPGAQRHVVIAEVAAIWIEIAVFRVYPATVQRVDGPIVELVAF